MIKYRPLMYRGAALVVGDNGDIYRDAHFTQDAKGNAHFYARTKLTAVLDVNQHYLRVSFRVNGIMQNLFVHRAVALAFLGEPPEPDMVVNHINEDKTDNRLENLEWITQQGNYQFSLDLHPERLKAPGKRIKQVKDNVTVGLFCSAHEAARQLGYDSSGIARAARSGGPYKGFYWKYMDEI